MQISVVTVSFNAARTIGATLNSILTQSLAPEHLVIDGGSRDGTAEIVRQMAPNAVCISEQDAGLYDAMNKGVALASGDYVGFLNADDVYARPDALQQVHDRLVERPVDVLCGGIVMVRDSSPGRIVRSYRAAGFRPWQLRFGHMPPHPGVFVRRQLLLETPFRTDLRIVADYAQMLSLLRRRDVKWAILDATLVAMRIGGVSTSGLSANVHINAEILQVLRENNIAASKALVWSKYLAKCAQFIGRPGDLPRGWRAAF